jgi:hypothetical protein
MKYLIYLIVGLIAVTLLAPNVEFQNIKNAKTATVPSTNVEALKSANSEKPVEKPVEPPKERTFAELTLEEKIKANPNKCDLTVQVMYEEGGCHNTTVAPANTVPTTSAITGGGDCEASIRRIFPANEHARAIKVMIQESSRNPSIHNYNPSTGDDSYGCFQINLAGNNKYSRPSPAELVIADNNVSFAYNLWKSTGWCSTGGWLNTGRKVGIC